ncbi:MAG TPA: CHASE2 domain-containing protein, partial [bacterium]|nr:CHASE2 domain-containing protein [bacterium]
MWKFRKSPRIQKAAWAVGIGLAAALLALALTWFRLFAAWELKTYDLRMQAFKDLRPSPQNVVMFYVNEDSLRFMEGHGIKWPWPREIQASVLEFCRRGGAKAVLFDIFFSEDSVYGVDDDKAFAEGIEAGPPSYFVLFLSKNEGDPDPRIERILEKSALRLASPLPQFMPSLKSMKSLPVDGIVESAAGFGNAQMPPDDDGTYRRIWLAERLGSDAIPSIPLEVASAADGRPAIDWTNNRSFLFGNTEVPLDTDGRMMINYYGGVDTFPNYPLAQVVASEAAIDAGMAPDIDPSVVKNKIVIIGVAAPGLYDLKPTPLARVFPGPEVHATVIENLLTGDFITPFSAAAIASAVIASGLLAAIGLAAIGSTAGMGAWLAGTLFVITGAAFALFWRGVWMPLF